MLNELGWLSIMQRIRFNVLVMIFKIKNGLTPQYLSDDITFVHEVHDINLRSNENFRLPKYKTSITRNSIFYEGIKLYNGLPKAIKDITNLNTFKTKCKDYVMNETPI